MYTRSEGVAVEAMGRVWVAFSAATGETSLLNDEAASILEMLDEGPATTHSICAGLLDSTGVGMETLAGTIEACWPRLIEAGLVQEQCKGQADPP